MKLAVITGVSRGLGEALLTIACDKFDTVIAIGRSLSDFPEPKAELIFIEADLSDRNIDWYDRFSSLTEFSGSPSIYFLNNAAVLEILPTAHPEFSKRLVSSLDINTVSPIAITNALTRLALARRGEMTIVHIGTGASQRPIANWGAYCVTKSAVSMFFEVFASEHPQFTVHDIDPGIIDSDMQKKIRRANHSDSPANKNPEIERSKSGLKLPSKAATEIFAAVGL